MCSRNVANAVRVSVLCMSFYIWIIKMQITAGGLHTSVVPICISDYPGRTHLAAFFLHSWIRFTICNLPQAPTIPVCDLLEKYGSGGEINSYP